MVFRTLVIFFIFFFFVQVINFSLSNFFCWSISVFILVDPEKGDAFNFYSVEHTCIFWIISIFWIIGVRESTCCEASIASAWTFFGGWKCCNTPYPHARWKPLWTPFFEVWQASGMIVIMLHTFLCNFYFDPFWSYIFIAVPVRLHWCWKGC